MQQSLKGWGLHMSATQKLLAQKTHFKEIHIQKSKRYKEELSDIQVRVYDCLASIQKYHQILKTNGHTWVYDCFNLI